MIILLNGETYAKEEILGFMGQDDSFYYEKLDLNALSQSSLKLILNDPYDYLRKLKGKATEKSDALIMGNLVHNGDI